VAKARCGDVDLLGKVPVDPPQCGADDRSLVPLAVDDGAANTPDLIADPRGGCPSCRVFDGARLTVQEMGAAQAEFDLGMVAESDRLAVDQSLAATPTFAASFWLTDRGHRHHRPITASLMSVSD
jgi:hypothetical protein